MLSRVMLAAAFAGLAACASSSAPPSYALRPAASDGQDLSHLAIDPDTIIESRLPSGVVSIRTTEQLSGYGASFIVAVQNVGPGPQTFGPENVAAKTGRAKLKVFTVEELGRTISEKAHPQATEQQDPPARHAATNPTVTSARARSDAAVFGGQGAQANSSSASQTIAPAAPRAQSDLVANLRRDTLLVSQSALRSGPVPAGAVVGGLVVVGHPKPGETLEVTVTFAGQPHRFAFAVQPAG